MQYFFIRIYDVVSWVTRIYCPLTMTILYITDSIDTVIAVFLSLRLQKRPCNVSSNWRNLLWWFYSLKFLSNYVPNYVWKWWKCRAIDNFKCETNIKSLRTSLRSYRDLRSLVTMNKCKVVHVNSEDRARRP